MMAKTLYDDCYIVMSEYGIQRMTKRKPALQGDEVAVKVRLHIPQSAFKEPDFSAELTVPESAVIAPEAHVQVVE